MTCLPSLALSDSRTQHPGCWDLLLANSETTRQAHCPLWSTHSPIPITPNSWDCPPAFSHLPQSGLCQHESRIKDISWRQAGMVKVSQKTAQTLHPEASLISITNLSHMSLLFQGGPESKWRRRLWIRQQTSSSSSQPLFRLFPARHIPFLVPYTADSTN